MLNCNKLKKIFVYITILMLATFQANAQDATTDSTDDVDQITQIKNEIALIKRDLADVKERTSWMNMIFQGATRITWGLNLWATKVAAGETATFNSPTPVATGFDFENDILFRMNFANRVLAKSFNQTEGGTEIFVKMKIDSYGVSELKPKGSWYVVDATTDMGKKVQVYLPRTSGNASNVVLGDVSVVLDQARVSHIAGTGFYVDYSDVTQVDEYYGVKAMTDVMVLNHNFFNNGYFYDRLDGAKYSSLYYSFDTRPFSYLTGERIKYSATSGVAEAVKLWANGMLRDSTTNAECNQHPHGITLGFEDDITKGFFANVAIGAASKDAFDPKYYEDNNIDYGFFLKGGVRLHSNKFEFYPRASISVAFQTGTTEDYDYGWVTLAAGLTLPFLYNLPTGEKDRVKLEANWNINAQFALSTVATMFSLFPEFTLLNEKLFIKLPIIYSYKNGTGGFLRGGNESVKWIDQLYEDHIFNLSFVIGFDSQKLFGEIFEFVLTNTLYYTYLYAGANESYFYEIIRTDFNFNNIPSGPLKFGMYAEFGLGYAYNARLIDSATSLKYEYNYKSDKWVSINEGKELTWTRFSGTVVRLETGFTFDVIKNFSVGFATESPYLLLDFINPIGNQQTFGTFKLWSEIRF